MPNEALTNQEREVLSALQQVYELYKGDGELVRPSAEKHGVEVVYGSPFDEPIKDNYNFRLLKPTEENARLLACCDRVAFLCEDYRQFTEAVKAADLHPENDDAVFGLAGGSAQPEENRFNALVTLGAAVLKANPDARLLAGIHTGVCGGAEQFSGNQMSKILENDGPQAELDKMIDYRTKYIEAVVAAGGDRNRIDIGTAIVDGHHFVRWE